jgi:general secretion pathway protein F
MKFVARVLTADNRIEAMPVDAADTGAAKTELEARHLSVLSIEASVARYSSAKQGSFSLLEFSQELIALLTAGLNLVEAVEALLDKEESAEARTVLQSVLQGLRQGRRLSDALHAQPNIFPPLFIGLVRSAEGTSNLPEALVRYLDYGMRVRALKARFVSAAIYPAVLLVAGSAVCLFLMTYVVPRFASVYQSSGRALPWQSQWLLSWGQWLSAHPGLAGAVVAAAIAGGTYTIMWLGSTGRTAKVVQALPWVGPRLALLELTRLYLTMGMLLEGGIPVRSALDLVAASASKARRDSLAGARSQVSDGSNLSDALQEHGLSTPIALRLLRVGERSGQLGPMLTQAANFHEAESARWIERFSRLIEPILTVIIGLVIGLIVVMLYIPILDLAGGV